MKDVVIGLLSDCITFASQNAPTATVGAIASSSIGRMLSKRHEILREIIRSEIRQGNFEGVDEDDITSIFFRLIRDAQEGVAQNNLRLMARSMNGLAEKKKLSAPTFLKYSNILAGLNEEEIGVLAIMAKYWSEPELKNIPSINASKDGLEYRDPEREALKAAFPNYASIQQALVRTGLVFFTVNSHTGDDFKFDGGNFSGNPGSVQMNINSKVDYQLTPLMAEILKYTNFLL